MICIDYYEARQRKNRANSWNDCHSRVEVSRQQAQKKICLDFEREIFITSVWLQAGQYLALSAQIPAKPKSAVVPYFTPGDPQADSLRSASVSNSAESRFSSRASHAGREQLWPRPHCRTCRDAPDFY
jgi:hypothetical protein